jgi:hypothetical protein
MSDKITDMLTALQQYTTSVKLGANHAARVIVMAHRFQVLKDIFDEMNAAMLVEHEAVKEIMDAGIDPEPQAYKDFLAHYEDFKVVHKLMQATAKEVEEEKGFIDWHMANGILPDYEAAMKHLKGLGNP